MLMALYIRYHSGIFLMAANRFLCNITFHCWNSLYPAPLPQKYIFSLHADRLLMKKRYCMICLFCNKTCLHSCSQSQCASMPEWIYSSACMGDNYPIQTIKMVKDAEPGNKIRWRCCCWHSSSQTLHLWWVGKYW